MQHRINAFSRNVKSLTVKMGLFFVLCAISISGYSQLTQLPTVEAQKLGGQKAPFTSYVLQGQITVVVFWATWNSPSKKQLDNIAEIYEDWQDDYNVKLIAVSTDGPQTGSRVAATVSTKSWEYEVLLDPNGELMQAIGVSSVPYTLIVDQNKNIAYRRSGYSEGDEVDVEDKIALLSN
ncbi:MAG: TlpA disulfide reductase family protein [Bacteroidota bacterium]